MKYYNIVNNEIELTDAGKGALNELGITLEELKAYPYEKLSPNYWTGCKTYVEQALKNGKGVTWLDDCRIGIETRKSNVNDFTNIHSNKFGSGAKIPSTGYKEVQGRFPGNLLVSDDVLNDGKPSKSGVSKIFHNSYLGNSNTNFLRGISSPENQHNDSGSFSRFFSLDAWWEEKIKQLPEPVQKTFPFLIVPKASRTERNKGLDSFKEERIRGDYNDGSQMGLLEKIQNSPRPNCKNHHPTVKPIKLMSYLVTLGSRKGDLVLDPFVGSGTTAIACKMLNRNFIGFEISPEYVEIAEARLRELPKL